MRGHAGKVQVMAVMLVAWAAVVPSAAAQVGSGSLTGRVKDDSGAAVAAGTRWFNTDAFSPAPRFTIGSSSRNPVRGPGYRNLDLALIRRVALPNRTRLEIRAEIFNITNTTALGAPNGVQGSPAFGTITTAGDPRVVQIGVKVGF